MATIFLSGATGYIGGRLAPKLLEDGHTLRCLTRSARKLRSRPWATQPRVKIVEGDASDEELLTDALRGCDVAFYLIHSMESAGRAYRRRDRELAQIFANASAAAGVQRIIYLGGLGEINDDLSEHLSSRREVEDALRSAGVPVTVFRAAMIIGSGSASFEILRYLVERLPIMVTPKWVRTKCQPIAVRNVLHALQTCLTTPETIDRTIDIGGPEVLTYRQIMSIMAEERGLPRRLVIPVPVLTPRLSSLWIHLVTPLSHRIARPLAEGLRNEVVCRDDTAQRLMPQQLLTVREAIAAALGRHASGAIDTHWSDAGPMPGDPDWSGGTVFTDERSMEIAAEPAVLFRTLCSIGGERGYFSADWLWRLRGWMDHMVGGPGLRRGRRDASSVTYGDALDFWRVVGIEADRRLELRAEMKLPGVATLSFTITPLPSGHSTLTQTARFKPKGLLGLAYWYTVLPLHNIVFQRMLSGIRDAAERSGSESDPVPNDTAAYAPRD